MRRRLITLFLVLGVVVAATPHCWDVAAGASEPTATKTSGKVPETLGQYLERTGVVVMVDGEWVQNTQDLWAWLGLNHFEHANVWHDEDGRDGLYSGGLQFYPPMWDHMGCDEFAPTPARASINDQIACGRRLKDAVDAEGHNGWGQWPLSSKAAGLR